MILLNDDWNRFPNTIPDDKTSNKSFLELAALYKSMGIKNYAFHLALHQPELQGVNPHDLNNLTEELKAKIIIECHFNFWYFLREVIRLPTGGPTIQFKANRGNMALLWSFFMNIDFSLITPRQVGKSTTLKPLDIWLLQYRLKDTGISHFTQDTKLRKEFIEDTKSIINLLPDYLDKTIRNGSNKDADNTESITCNKQNTILTTSVGQLNIENAERVGRGSSRAITQCDEAPYIPNIHISLPVLLKSSITKRRIAHENGLPYCNLTVTTPGKLNTKGGKFMYERIFSGMYWSEILLDSKDKEEVHTIVRNNSKDGSLKINGTFNHRQLGKTDAQVLEDIKVAGGSIADINRDYFNKWESGSEDPPIDAKLLEIITMSQIPACYSELSKDKYVMNWYIPKHNIEQEMTTIHHIIGIDSSEAIGMDPTAIILTNTLNMEVTATCSISESTSLLLVAEYIALFLIKYPNTTLIIENKSSGQMILDTVVAILISHGINPFKRIFNKIVHDNVTHKEVLSLIEKTNVQLLSEIYYRYKDLFGFKTGSSGNSRKFLYSTVLQDAVNSTGHLIRDIGLSTELNELVKDGDRVDHPPGGHDDMVIAWLLTHWLMKYSNNLNYYGIDTFKALSLVTYDGALLTNEQLADRRQILIIKDEIEILKEKLIASPNIYEIKKFETLLENKVIELTKFGDKTLTIDSIRNEITERKVPKRNLSESLKRQQLRTFNNFMNR